MSFSKVSDRLSSDKKNDGLRKSEIEHFIEDETDLKAAGTFRVATYNILSSRIYDPKGRSFNPQKDYKFSWEFRKNLVAEAIKRLNVDILALQEVRPDQLSFMAEELSDFGVMGFSEHSGKSLEQIREEKLSDDDIRELVPILYRKDLFKLIESRRWFLSETPNEVSSFSWASRPRIVVAGAFEYLADNTIIIVSNTHYDHLNTTERLKQAGHRECMILEEFCASYPNAKDILYLGDRNSFDDEKCDGNQWYSEFKRETGSEDARLLAAHFGSSITWICYEPDKYKIDYEVLDTIFHKGQGKVTQSLNSLVEYEFVQLPENETSATSSASLSAAKLCSFFGKPKNPTLERQFASDHTCVMADIQHVVPVSSVEVESTISPQFRA